MLRLCSGENERFLHQQIMWEMRWADDDPCPLCEQLKRASRLEARLADSESQYPCEPEVD